MESVERNQTAGGRPDGEGIGLTWAFFVSCIAIMALLYYTYKVRRRVLNLFTILCFGPQRKKLGCGAKKLGCGAKKADLPQARIQNGMEIVSIPLDAQKQTMKRGTPVSGSRLFLGKLFNPAHENKRSFFPSR